MAAVRTRLDGGQMIVALHGDLDFTGAAEAAVAASAAPGQRVIVDLAGLGGAFGVYPSVAAACAADRPAVPPGGQR